MDTDNSWKSFGEVDPYFGVLTCDEYRSDRLSDGAREKFFQSGEDHAKKVLSVLREINPDFSPRRSLDFGCGVGRVTLPLAHESNIVVGVDVSPGMLSEAQRNAVASGVDNITFTHTVTGSFNLVHSVLVFQHIPPRRGARILAELASRLDTGGMIILQVPYHRDAPLWQKLATAVKRTAPVINGALNLVEGRRFSYPTMTMFCYDFATILAILRGAGIGNLRIDLDTPVQGYAGAMLYGEKHTV